ncbi:MAG: DNA helicase RecQ [Candidatus Adiutrix sp.]|jgi:ATP-dependent DNA helicase RecQ|nr:DNA helicase RecQ [Candidatus Adiutrix sp.]
METRLEQTLSDLFGFHSFRPGQREIVEALIGGRDVFAVMPTGGGKSLCYQLPARLMEGTAVVVSPLISLMKDQVDAALANGLRAGAINSSLTAGERAATFRSLRAAELELLYVSPERLLMPDFLGELEGCRLSFFAIDEAHCVSEWGHDFRPDYLGLSELARRFPGLPLAAFTATATLRVAGDISARLGLRSPCRVRASFNRPNLFYQVSPREDWEKQLMEFLTRHPGEPGIVYRAARKSVEATAAFLARRGVAARAYHAGLDDETRRAAQDDFRHDRCQVIVATVAFGMGIDKSNVRFVVHGDLPKNLESYYQETGRAGRDQEPAHCALFYGGREMVLWRRFAEEIPDQALREAALEQLRRMIDFACRDGCRRQALLAYFDEKIEGGCGACDVCAGEVERVDAARPARMALSAMARTGGRFGARHIEDILVGADTDKIRRAGHDKLPTYGVGRDYDRRFWRRLIGALEERGLAERADGDYPTLSVSPRAWPLLRGETAFHMLKAARPQGGRGVGRAEAGAAAFSGELLDKLKAERRRLANEAGLAAYMIFSDRTLREIAEMKPRDQASLLKVAGVGRHKLAVYGQTFLAVVESYFQSRGEGGPSSAELTGRLLREGLGLAEAAEARGLTRGTILKHLEELAGAGWDFPAEQFISPGRLEEIGRAFEAAEASGADGGFSRLRPVVEASSGGITYEEARLARLFLRGRYISSTRQLPKNDE